MPNRARDTDNIGTAEITDENLTHSAEHRRLERRVVLQTGDCCAEMDEPYRSMFEVRISFTKGQRNMLTSNAGS